MSDSLRNKLKTHQDSKKINEFLGRINLLEILGFADVNIDFSAVQSGYQEITQIASMPFASISINAERSKLEKWLRQILEAIDHQNPVYLQISEYFSNEWIQVKSAQFDDALLEIWNHLESKDMAIVSHDLETLLVIFEEESQFEGHLKNM
jgi:hypothetical protein